MLEELRELYLQDLERLVSFRGEPLHPRVKKPMKWRKVQTKLAEGVEEPIKLMPDDLSRKVWLWGDQHFGHKHIIKYEYRPFPDMDLMFKCMLGNYLRKVKPNDICIWGGDVSFYGTQNVNDLLDQFPGYKILIVGNHDFKRTKIVRNMNFHEIHLIKHIKIGEVDFVITHYPMHNCPEDIINIHGHMHTKKMDSKQHFNISVEQLNYIPINILDIYKGVKKDD